MKSILVISDLHTGSVFGIFPKNYKTRHQNEISLNPIQNELYELWEKMSEDVRKENYDYVFLLGDLIDGLNTKGAGRERVVNNLNEQMDAALKLLRPLCNRKEVIGITSSPYHNSVDYEVDREICKQLHGHFLGTIANIRIKNTNKVINIGHGSGGSPIYAGTKASKDILLALSSERLEKIPDVDVICLASDTEILTAEGWKTPHTISNRDIPFSLNLKTKKIEKDIVKDIIRVHYNGPAYEGLSTPFLVSKNHRMVYRHYNSKHQIWGEWLIGLATDLHNLRGNISIPRAGNLNPELFQENLSDDLIKMVAWIISEGHFRRDHDAITISQSAKVNLEYTNEIRNILEKCNIGFNEYTDVGGTGINTFYIITKEGEKIRKIVQSKNIPEWVIYLNNHQFDIFVNTYTKGDGSFNDASHHSGKIYSGNKNLIERLQIALTLHGYRSHFVFKKGGFKDGCWLLYWSKYGYLTLTRGGESIKEIKYNGIMWCVNTKNTTLIARRNGYPFITGNCRAHQHSYLHLEQLGKHMIWNPCFEGPRLNTYSMGSYARWQPEIGVVKIGVTDDAINVTPFLYSLKHERKNIKVI